MNLGKKIQLALQHYSSIYVPELGTFSKIHISSSYDEARNVYLPPIDYVEYDHDSKIGTSILEYLNQENSAQLAEQESLVSEAVNEIKVEIATSGQYLLEDLGHIVRYGDSYIYKPIDLTAFQLEPVVNTGTNPFEDKDQSVEDVKSDDVQQIGEPVDEREIVESPASTDQPTVEEELSGAQAESVSEPVEAAPVIAPLETTSTAPQTNESQDPIYDEEEVPKRSNTIWYVLIAVAAACILILLLYRNGFNSGNNIVDTRSQDSVNNVLTEESKATSVDTISSSIRTQDTAVTEVKRAWEGPIIPEDHTYYIVIGSRMSPAVADEMAQKYRNDGFDRVRVLRGRSGASTVIWDSYKTKAELDSALRYVTKNQVSDAWSSSVK